MITPSFSLTATERVLPSVAIDFTTGLLDSRITFTRTDNTATYINSSGVITAINANLPRFDYDPVTLACKGLLIESSSKNILLNSLLNGTSLSTQSVTTAASQYTLSFYGTGSIDLTGTHTATVAGTGAYPSRKSYTFTPTAGTLTLTVSGTVQYAQLEVNAFASSFIPTDNTAGGITRNADLASMTGTNFSNWFNATNGSIFCEFQWETTYARHNAPIIRCDDGTNNNFIQVGTRNVQPTAPTNTAIRKASGTTYETTTGNVATNTGAVIRMVGAYDATNIYHSANGTATATVAHGGLPTVNVLRYGSGNTGPTTMYGTYIRKMNYYPMTLTTDQIQAFSK